MSENGESRDSHQKPVNLSTKARRRDVLAFQEEASIESLNDFLYENPNKPQREQRLRGDRGKVFQPPQSSVIIPDNIASQEDYENRIEEQYDRFQNTPPGQRTPAMDRFGQRHEADIMRHNIINGTNGRKPGK